MKLDSSERERIIQLVKQQVVPAVGCTEPVCVALCVSRAVETLGVLPAKIDVYLSANILKNAKSSKSALNFLLRQSIKFSKHMWQKNPQRTFCVNSESPKTH